MSLLPVVDAHHHLWDLQRNHHPWLQEEAPIPFRYGDYAAIRRDYLPADYLRDAAGQNVVRSVYVEAEWDPRDPVGETRWLHEVAERHGFPHAMVAQAWLDRDDAAEVLVQQAAFPLVRSVRHKPRAAASPGEVQAGAPGSMGCPRWRAGYALLARHGLSFDLQTPWWHLAEAAALARDFPETTLILNHTGLPADRSPAGLEGWREAMRTLAAEPNTAVKISGLGLADATWPVAQNRELVQETLGIFGTARCMVASNYPVDSLVAGYDTIFGETFRPALAHLPEGEQRAVLHDNAVRIYRIAA